MKSYIKTVCLFLLALGASSCVKEHVERGGNDGTGSAMVKISIHTPTSSLPKATKNATADECMVSQIKVVVLELDGAGYKFRYMVDGQQIVQDTQDAQLTTFSALLRSSDVPLKLLLVSNYNDAFNALDFSVTTGEEEVRARLVDTFSPDMKGRLPMFGELELTKLNAEQTNAFSATMLRSIARVDVNNKVNENISEAFELDRVYIYRANDKLNLIPEEGNMKDDSFSAKAPTIPAGTSRMAAYSKGVTAEGDLSVSQIYLPESESVSQGEQLLGATCVVVGGYFADDDFLSYYRIDFDSGIAGHPFGQVLRNHKYIFNIQEVNYRGWPTPDEAANNEASSIHVTVQVWDELTSEMHYSGDDNYLGISSRKVVLDYFQTAQQIVYIQSTVPFSIQATDENGNPTGTAISSNGQSFENDFFKLTIEKNPSDADDVYRLLITALEDNYSNFPYIGYFQVISEKWVFNVEVQQETYNGIYSNRIVKILTITSLYGDLGKTDGTFTERSGVAMRRVLENPVNFSPEGIVPVGGIIIYDLLNETISSSESSTLYILQKMLETVDVVQLPYECTPSPKASQLIYEWLTANGKRALILGTEPVSNQSLIDYFDCDGEWKDPGVTVTEIGIAPEDLGTDYFFYGPFGDVTPNTGIGIIEGRLGYNDGYNYETTTPILVASRGTDNQGKMTHGVNRQLGVFYCGTSEVTTTKGNFMSQIALYSGTVSSEFDILMANVWSYIIDRVVQGSELIPVN